MYRLVRFYLVGYLKVLLWATTDFFMTLPLGYAFRKHNLSFHCLADDVQIHLAIKPNSSDSLQRSLNCNSDLMYCLDINVLHLNERTGERIIFGSAEQQRTCVALLEFTCQSVKNSFKFNKQISFIVKTSFFLLPCPIQIWNDS